MALKSPNRVPARIWWFISIVEIAILGYLHFRQMQMVFKTPLHPCSSATSRWHWMAHLEAESWSIPASKSLREWQFQPKSEKQIPPPVCCSCQRGRDVIAKCLKSLTVEKLRETMVLCWPLQTTVCSAEEMHECCLLPGSSKVFSAAPSTESSNEGDLT